jgi:hypothetical protein
MFSAVVGVFTNNVWWTHAFFIGENTNEGETKSTITLVVYKTL